MNNLITIFAFPMFYHVIRVYKTRRGVLCRQPRLGLLLEKIRYIVIISYYTHSIEYVIDLKRRLVAFYLCYWCYSFGSRPVRMTGRGSSIGRSFSVTWNCNCLNFGKNKHCRASYFNRYAWLIKCCKTMRFLLVNNKVRLRWLKNYSAL